MNPVLAILFILHFLNDGVRATFIALLPFIAKDIQMSFTQIGFLSSSLGIIMFFLAMPAGFLVLRMGGFNVLFFALLFYTVGALGVGLSPNFIILLSMFFLAAPSFGVFHTAANILVARSVDKTSLGRMLGDYSAFGDTGRILLPFLAIFVAVQMSWRNAFFAIAVLGIVAFILGKWIMSLREQRQDVQPQKKQLSYKEWLKELSLIFRQRRVLAVIAAGWTDNLAANSVSVFFPFLLLARGISTQSLAFFIATFFIGSLIGKSLLGRGVDVFGSKRMFILTEILMAITLFILAFSYNFFVLLGVSFLLGAFTRGTAPIISTLFAKIVHEKHYEKIFSISETIFGISITTAPLLAGIVADKFGITVVFYVAGVLALLAALPIIFLHYRDKKREQEIYQASERV
jgi:MFS transporter, FSR family, fosmidomycin resistance protein